MARLKIMCGLPRSGKTTRAKQMEESGWIRVSPDDIRRAIYGQPFLAQAESLVWATAEIMARALLIGGRKVVIDATNTRRRERSTWLRLASEFGLRPEIEWMIATDLECLARRRPDESVPDEVIVAMAERFEKPITDEGDIYQPVFQLAADAPASEG